MAPLPLRQWWNRWTRPYQRGKRRAAPPNRQGRRLHLEVLEGRDLPSTVTNLLDSGPGSLRQALIDTPSGDTVDFLPGLTGTIRLTTGELMIAKDLTVAGPGAGVITVSGNHASRVFNIAATFTVGIGGLTIADGMVSAGDNGGVILNAGTLTVTASTVSGNSASEDFQTSGLFNLAGGAATVTASTFSGNSGVAITNLDGELTLTASIVSGSSIGLSNQGGMATLTSCTISGNGLGIASGNRGTVNVTGSTISGNVGSWSGLAPGAGIYNDQGGLMTISNSTISGNSTPFYGGGIVSFSTMTISNSTISGNSASTFGGGIVTDLRIPTITNTIVAGNVAPSGPDVVGLLNSQGHNLIGVGDGGTGFVATDLVGTSANPIDPRLGPLQNNGGLTATHALLPRSPAIDRGDDVVLGPPFNFTTDQRGFPRRAGAVVDVGAFELQVAVSAVLVVGADNGAPTHVAVLGAVTGVERFGFLAYPGFNVGVRVAAGDVTGDGIPDIITGPGPGGGPHIRVIDGQTQADVYGFMAFAAPGVPLYLGGVHVAAGDINGDGRADIIVGAGDGGGSRVQVYSGLTGALIQDFFAYHPAFAVGARVGAADVNGDSRADIITAPGPGGGPHVQALDGLSLAVLASFYAYAPSYSGGVYLAGGDVTGDNRAEIITGAVPGLGEIVRIFDAPTGRLLASFMAYDPSMALQPMFADDSIFLHTGVRVAAIDVTGDQRVDIITAQGRLAPPLVRVFNGMSLEELDRFFAFDPAFLGGTFVGAA